MLPVASHHPGRPFGLIFEKTLQKTHRKNNDAKKANKGPKGDQKTTDKGGKGRDPGWNPPRKKKNIAKPDLLRGKGACWKGKPQTLRMPTRPCGGPHTARGRISDGF